MSFFKEQVKFQLPIPSVGELEIDAIINFDCNGKVKSVDYNNIGFQGTDLTQLLLNFPEGVMSGVLDHIEAACENNFYHLIKTA